MAEIDVTTPKYTEDCNKIDRISELVEEYGILLNGWEFSEREEIAKEDVRLQKLIQLHGVLTRKVIHD